MPSKAVASIHVPDAEASEVLMINALLQTGEFLPIRYGVSIEDVDCYEKVWRFCEEYQAIQSEAPTNTLVAMKFPDFPIIKTHIGAAYAAKALSQDALSRRIRIAMGSASSALRSGDNEEAMSYLNSLATAARPTGKPGHSIWDEADAAEEGPKYPTPWPTLTQVTGGLGTAELWYIAGLAGHGKTQMLCKYVATLLNEGATVSYLSLEMPTRTINKRVRRALANPTELDMLDARTADDRPDFESINTAIDAMQSRVPGNLRVYDSSHGRVTPATVKYHCSHSDFVVVDHIGLMYTPDGRRAVDDWRLYATISNHLLEEKNATSTSILAAAQLNRTADTNSKKAPTLDSMGGAYQLVQDADVIVTLRRRGKRAMVQCARKVREAVSDVSWYTHFDVKRAKFDEISAEKADELETEYPIDQF